MLQHGCDIKPEVKALMFENIPKDEWAAEDTERKTHIDNLIQALENYNGEPVQLTREGLFEVLAKKLGG